MIRKLLRRVIKWALAEPEPVTLVNWDVNTGMNRFDAERIFACRALGRQVVVKTILQTKLNREL